MNFIRSVACDSDTDISYIREPSSNFRAQAGLCCKGFPSRERNRSPRSGNGIIRQTRIYINSTSHLWEPTNIEGGEYGRYIHLGYKFGVFDLYFWKPKAPIRKARNSNNLNIHIFIHPHCYRHNSTFWVGLRLGGLGHLSKYVLRDYGKAPDSIIL